MTGLIDDIYRSLAYLVRDAGGYDKVPGYYFQEFFWANFLRDNDVLHLKDDKDKVLEYSRELSMKNKKNPDKPAWDICEVTPYIRQCLDNSQEHILKKYTDDAVKLAHSKAASDLPGFNG